MEIGYIKAVACLVVVILVCMGIFQLLLALGLPLGDYAWGGKDKVLPNKLRISSFISFFILNFIAIIFLQNVGIVNIPVDFLNNKIIIWVFAAFFAINSLGNLASTSKKEKLVMTPITIVLTIASIIIAISL